MRALTVTGISFTFLFAAGIWGKSRLNALGNTNLLEAGILGTVLILISLTYSLRKRYWKVGKIKIWLRAHEITALSGTVICVGHTGIRTYNITGWLAVLLLMILCGSGVIGRYIYMELGREVAQVKKQDIGKPENEKNDELLGQIQWWRNRFQIWRKLHIPLTELFLAVLLIHVIGTAFYGGW